MAIVTFIVLSGDDFPVVELQMKREMSVCGMIGRLHNSVDLHLQW